MINEDETAKNDAYIMDNVKHQIIDIQRLITHGTFTQEEIEGLLINIGGLWSNFPA